MSDKQENVVHMDVVVVGAGFAGLYMIHKAQRVPLLVLYTPRTFRWDTSRRRPRLFAPCIRC